MKRTLYLCIAYFLGMNFSYGQIDPEESREHIILKWSPLSLFDIDNTFQVGAEIPLANDRFTIQQDIGYGKSSFNIWYAEEENNPNKSTVKSRTQFRYYFYEKTRFRSYIAGEYLYKRVVNQETQFVGMDCSNTGGCAYFQEKNVKQGRFVSALHAKVGWQFYFSNRTTLDLFTGFGLRKANVRLITPNVGNARFDSDWDFWRDNSIGSHEVIPSISMGFHLGIALGRFR